MDRRDFVKGSAGVLAGLSLSGSLHAIEGKEAIHNVRKKKRIGIQLYSLRDDMQKDPDATIRDQCTHRTTLVW